MTKRIPLDDATTIIDCLDHYARVTPSATAYTFLADGDSDERTLTYADLRARARRVAGLLQACSTRDEAVLLLFPSGLEFIIAFFGCLYARAIAVPANLARNSHHYQRLRQIIEDCQARVVLTTNNLKRSVAGGLQAGGVDIAKVAVLSEADATEAIPAGFDAEPLAPNRLAFLQYTSGSTGQPKGVMVSHGQLIANERAIRHTASHTEHLQVGGWLPQFHDMGLIGTTLQPLALGGHYVFMSPLHFIHRPMRWLVMLGRFRSMSTAAPNFALDLCVKAAGNGIPEDLDLSALETLFCGSETVSAAVVRRFNELFSPYGLKPEAVKPCYGLAEATLVVSGGTAARAAPCLSLDRDALAHGRAHVSVKPGSQMVVCCGAPIPRHETAIVSPETLEILPEGHVGEIWFSGPSAAGGYWRNPEATETTFRARTACNKGPFMRTGDLGFLKDGGLYITGRAKEMMIIRGKNYFPHDIESVIAETSAPYGAFQATVFADETSANGEVIALLEIPRRSVAAMSPDFQKVVSAARHAVLQSHEIRIKDLYIVTQGTVPRTSSGKTQRLHCLAAYRDGLFDNDERTLYSRRNAAPHTTE